MSEYDYGQALKHPDAAFVILHENADGWLTQKACFRSSEEALAFIMQFARDTEVKGSERLMWRREETRDGFYRLAMIDGQNVGIERVYIQPVVVEST